jgi:hypothetical protein
MTKLELELSDVITIKSKISPPATFFVKYIDSIKIVLINIETFSQISLEIDPITGYIKNYNDITEIVIVYRNPIKGFAAQNNLVLNTWVELEVDGTEEGEVVIANGQIIEVNGDQLSIQLTIPSQILIYIDFEYKGLSDSSPIKKIRLIPSPSNNETNQELVEKTLYNNIDNQHTSDGNNITNDDVDVDVNVDVDDDLNLDTNPELIVEFKGDVEDTITELIDVDHSKNIYDIESQKLDLINSMLMSLPEHKRTDGEKAKIYKMVDQFVNLRSQYSNTDAYGNIVGVKTNNEHPLSDYFDNFNSNIRWLIPGVHSTKKTYNTSENYYGDLENINIIDDLDSIQTNIDTYRSSSSTSGINAYKQLYRQLHPKFTPFSHLHTAPMSTFEKTVKHNIHAIENSSHNYEAITAALGDKKHSIMNISNQKFVGQKYLPEENMLTLDVIRGTTKTKQRLTQLTRPDKLHINSFLVMPDTVINYSRVSLPGTNIMNRANLSSQKFETWKVLNNRTRNLFNVFVNPTENNTIKSYFIPTTPLGSPTNSSPDKITEVDNINSSFYSNQFSSKSKYDITNITHLNNTEISYSDLTKNIMPPILKIFDTLKPELYNVLSFEEIVQYFEPYLVYTNNFTHNDRHEINQFIKSNIDNYEQDLNNNKSYWQSKIDNNIQGNLSNSLIYDIRRISNKYTIQDNNVNYEPASDNIPNLSDILAVSVDDIKKIYSTHDRPNNMITTSEFLSNAYNHDGAYGLTTIIKMDTLNNTGPSTLSEYIEQESSSLKSQLSEIESNEQTNTCANVLANITAPTIHKLYPSLDSLLKDNQKSSEIYADAEYDTTPYHLLGDVNPSPDDYATLTSELASKHTNLTNQDIEKLVNDGIVKYTLINMLMKKYQITRPDAYNMATHILAGRRVIDDGDYAGIGESSLSIHSLFQRQNGVWVDKNSNNQFGNNNSINIDPLVKCNLTPNCVSTTPDTCRNIDARIVEHQQHAISNIYETFKSDFNTNKTIQLGELKQAHERNKQIQNKLQFIHGHVDLLANNKYYNFGHSFTQNDTAIISPASHVLSVIMKQQNLRKLQTDIVRFVTKFTRPYSPNTENKQPNQSNLTHESPFWLYCKQTGQPLLPVFKYDLANVFITNETQYPSAVLKAINTHGVLSDDGDMWIDKNTGMAIRSIDFDTSEGFDDAGFKITTRNILDTSDDTITSTSLDVLPMTATFIMIKHIVTAFTSLMGISFDIKQLNFILRSCTRVVDHNMGLLTGSEKEYMAVAKKRLEKGIKMPSYIFIYHKQIIYTIVGLILIIVQTSIPSIKRLKTVPGCIQSFTGYPLDQNILSQEGITYIACILKKLRSRLEPWNSIHKQLPDIITNIITTLQPENKNHMGILNVPEVTSLLELKRQYTKSIEVQSHEQNSINNDTINEEYTSETEQLHNSNSMFLPPQIPFQLGKIDPLQASDKNKLLKDLKDGLRDQTESILEAKSKLFKFSLKLQEVVEKIIKTESDDALLIKKINGELYLENACCVPTEGEKTVIQYFKNKDPEFGNILESIHSIESLIQNINKISKGSTLITTGDTRRKFLTNIPERTTTTINTGIIQLCKIGISKDPPMSIKQYCQSALDVSKKTSSSSLEELLELFHNESVVYTPDQFAHILQIVHSYNSINLKISYNIPKPYTLFNTELDKIDNYNIDDINNTSEPTQIYNESKLIALMKEKINNTNNQDQTEKINEFLSEQNKALKTFVWHTIQKQGSLSKITKGKQDHVKNIIAKFTTWNDPNNNTRNINFYKMQLRQLIKVIPSIILNSRNIEYDTTDPRLRPKATVTQLDTISQGIKKSYEPFLSLFDIPITNRVLQSIEHHNNPLLILSEATPAQLFSQKTTEKLYEYYFLKSLNNYIILSQTSEMVEDTNNQPSLKLKISNMLVEILQDIYTHKKTIDITHKHIMDRVFKRREIEKNAMIQKNRKKTVDEAVLSNEISRITVEVHDKYQLSFLDPFDNDNNEDDDITHDIEQNENDLIHNDYGDFE